MLTANRRPIPILVYHQIAVAPPKGSPFRGLYVSPQAFARQMAWLKWLGYTGLSMSALQPYLQGERTGKVVGITFDDGYQNNLTQALPVLARHGFSSTCYAVSGLLGKTNIWDERIGIPQTPLMDEGEIRQWVAGGQEIGSHTHRHVNLLETSEAGCREEMMLGKTGLESVTGRPVEHFCYPYGHYEARHVELARDIGFATATTTQRSRCLAGMDMLQLPRVPVLRSTTLPVFWLKIATAYEDRRKK
ncbi:MULTISPECIES: polysaccharide deacetylase family protein [unclassified Polaromonas]|uniref:polysaccharide deacetylase family protein n=1 Tax=unclassified Polaromonas TaxID=2638319 RepID=UPI000F0991E6|nr:MULTISPECIES: polysaccharide deacetylase family protein [unclassified Polaromonas]AYQ30593.1 polysaccharide deacetylase family protein [Polaromonas sp. SP1]QGJ19276.1 polysaccharide deacetylase family protein [Polaromonas sp. Pch-P]